MATQFSPAGAFRTGQTVTADGFTGIVVGWVPGPVGKQVAVRITCTKGGRRGQVRAFTPRVVAPRKGKRGRGPLPRIK